MVRKPASPSRDSAGIASRASASHVDEAAPVSAAPTIENLTIPEAKRLLAKSLGVPESAIKISIEH